MLFDKVLTEQFKRLLDNMTHLVFSFGGTFSWNRVNEVSKHRLEENHHFNDIFLLFFKQEHWTDGYVTTSTVSSDKDLIRVNSVLGGIIIDIGNDIGAVLLWDRNLIERTHSISWRKNYRISDFSNFIEKFHILDSVASKSIPAMNMNHSFLAGLFEALRTLHHVNRWQLSICKIIGQDIEVQFILVFSKCIRRSWYLISDFGNFLSFNDHLIFWIVHPFSNCLQLWRIGPLFRNGLSNRWVFWRLKLLKECFVLLLLDL